VNQKDFFKAIYATHSNVVLIRTDDNSVTTAYDVNDNEVNYDLAAVQAYIDANAYISKRQPEYPPLTDLADALYHQSKGDETKLTAYLAKCEAVKQKYPKE
jgi:myo-inositol-1-phosphate synthase